MYQLASATPGPILEVGSWIGRSTAVICHAISRRAEPIEFHTIDYGISSEAEWRELLGEDLRKKPNAHQYLPHINQPGGSITSLKRNMDERGFGSLVQIHKGDFHKVCPPGKFALIFCDATHSIEEIDANVPALLDKLLPGGIFACDDTHPPFEEHLRKRFKWKWAYNDTLLFYGEPA
jgi:predicted O-methyltransferase YrrM